MRRWKDQGIKAQTCVTSPPYYGLRDYGTAKWEGGDADCEHSISMPTKWNDPKRGTSVLRPETAHRGGSSTNCHKCGATRIDSQLGLEETPEQYIDAMVEVFRCVWDVLEDNGTLWLNIGDSYSRQGGQANAQTIADWKDVHRTAIKASSGADGCKPKDLIGIPWMLAFALRADGWYLRQDIIWHKPNPMPESVQDRCTKSHEYIFLMSKSQKYHYDHEAIKEEAISAGMISGSFQGRQGGAEYHTQSGGVGSEAKEYLNKNKRSVWTIPVKPYEGAHFAVFPQDLIEPCILAGAPVGGIVLDPFMGSGTTAQVAQQLGRQYLGCELNEDYKPLQQKRLRQMSLVLE